MLEPGSAITGADKARARGVINLSSVLQVLGPTIIKGFSAEIN